MWRVVPFVMLLLCLLFRGYSGTDDGHNTVRWYVTEELKNRLRYELPITGVVLKNNKPLHIILENFDVQPKSVECPSRRFDVTSELAMKAGTCNLIIKVNHVTDDMSTKWRCRAQIIYSGKHQYFDFKIRIKGLERVRVTVSGLELTYTQTEPSQVEYDGVAEYWYNDGEAVDLVCTRDAESNQEGYIRLTYYNAVGKMLFETLKFPVKYPVNLRKSLRAINNNDYVHCSYLSITDITYTYKTIFKFETTSLNLLKITVNNLKLVPIGSGYVRTEYQYKFYEGQMLTITCETDQHSLTNLSLFFNRPHLDAATKLLSDSENVPWKATKLIYTVKMLDSNYLECASKDNSMLDARLLLLLDQTELIIQGLTPSDVIHQYSRSNAMWVIDYQYTVNQTLSLTCVARKPNADYHWIFSSNSTVQPNISTSDPSRLNEFALNEGYDGMSIACDITYARAIVNLHVKPDSTADYIVNEDGMHVVIVGCALAVSALITLYLVIRCRRRKNKGGRQEPCENRTRERESTPADTSHRENTSVDCITTQDDSRVHYNYVYDHRRQSEEDNHVYEEMM